MHQTTRNSDASTTSTSPTNLNPAVVTNTPSAIGTNLTTLIASAKAIVESHRDRRCNRLFVEPTFNVSEFLSQSSSNLTAAIRVGDREKWKNRVGELVT
jgi:hypothetical protein